MACVIFTKSEFFIINYIYSREEAVKHTHPPYVPLTDSFIPYNDNLDSS